MPIKKVKKKTWDTFSKYIRLRDWKEQGEMYQGDTKVARCITCNKIYPIEGKGTMQAGHFIPGRKNQYLFDEKQVHAQCYNCNMNLKGNWPFYLEKMRQKYPGEVEKMIEERTNYKKYTEVELEELNVYFKAKLKELE